jgi:hypothetical protein
VRIPFAAPDEPLPYLLTNPAALAARRYAAPVDLVGDGSAARCEPTDAAPDLWLDVRDLGASYLGGTSLRTLAGAGLVVETTPGSVAAASAAFGWERAPASIEVF